jgi:dTDP-4-amino-4,6-dideoxygalactose transaminase
MVKVTVSAEVLANSEYAFDHGLILPTYSELTDLQIDYIANVILKSI